MKDIPSDWKTVKEKAQNAGFVMDYEPHEGGYLVWATDGARRWTCDLFDPNSPIVEGKEVAVADWQDFVNNYKPAIDANPPAMPPTVGLYGVGRLGRKLQIHESSRPDDIDRDYTTVWTGAGDDLATGQLGEGPLLQLDMTSTDTEKSVDAHFDPRHGEVWLHEGYAMWENAPWGCTIECAVVMPASPVQTASGLDYELDGNRLRPAAGGPGTGTHGLAGAPNPMPNPWGTGWFDPDPDLGLVPSPDGTGSLDIFVVDRPVSRFANALPLFGTSYTYFRLQSADSARLVPPTFVRLTARSPGGQAWKISFFLTLYRERTISPP